jgi:hypothetical protein
MRTRRPATNKDLRLAIDCLPRATRIAMLDGIRENEIIAGAYTNSDGICPMLAAHRAGGRTNASSFARAWDRFAFRGARVTGPRPATARELLILTSQLEASLTAEDAPDADLAEAIAAHQKLIARRAEHPDREPRTRHGWSWMRVVRSYDEYERILERLEQERSAVEERAAPQRATPERRHQLV